MPASPDPSTAPRKSSSRLALLAQFVLIPVVIVAIGLSVFLLFGLVAREAESPRAYLREIRSGSANRRWQAAFEFSRSLRRSRARPDPGLVQDVVQTLEWAKNDDPKVQRYLTRALGYLGDPAAVPALIGALDNPDADTRLWAAEALGSIGDSRARDALSRQLTSDDAGLRKQVIHSLGALGDARAADPIFPFLRDPVADVRWNAALALARLGDRRGTPVLLEMLNRSQLAEVPGIRPLQEERAIMAALIALSELGIQEARPLISQLSRQDESLRIRQAATQALEKLEQEHTDPS
ncbi:MAG: HEAT repeat domain-containing protein [Acidobacteriota bacterium]